MATKSAVADTNMAADDAISQHSSLRQNIAEAFRSSITESCLVIVILFNFALVIVEENNSAFGAELPSWIILLNYILSALYTIEACLKIYAFGTKYWKDPWNVTDACIVILDDGFILLKFTFGGALADFSFMRILRLLRLSRSKKLFRLVPEFDTQVVCLLGAFRSMAWGIMFICFTLLIFGVMGVMFIHPINQELVVSGAYDGCDRCPHAFESVWRATLTLTQQIVTGDSWGQLSIPIIEHQPWTIIYFALAFIIVGMALMNVILAAVVESAVNARANNDRLIAAEKSEERRGAKRRLVEVCTGLDEDNSGNVSKDEIITGMTTNLDFIDIATCMDITIDDIDIVWQILDTDNSGYVDYNEFSEQLYKMRSDDSHTLLMFIRCYVSQIRSHMLEEISCLKLEVLKGIQEAIALEKRAVDLEEDVLLQEKGRSLIAATADPKPVVAGIITSDRSYGTRSASDTSVDASSPQTQAFMEMLRVHQEQLMAQFEASICGIAGCSGFEQCPMQTGLASQCLIEPTSCCIQNKSSVNGPSHQDAKRLPVAPVAPVAPIAPAALV